jgi:ABC-2 type transport system ATP-binding protein
MKIIQTDSLVKKFGDFEAVKGVSFSTEAGEVFGFLGPNGAGKTTTINMLCTLLTPTSGNATVNGYDIVKQRDQVRESIGLVFQDSTLDDYMTAEQNLRFHAYAYGLNGKLLETRLKSLLEMVELWDRRGDKIRNFSGGMRRRLEITRGLLHHPKVLFLDEPTLGLDPQTRRHIWAYILGLRQTENLAIFMTTHYMEEAENCNRIAIMDHGQIVALDTPEKLKDMVGGDMIQIKTDDQEQAARILSEKYGFTPQTDNGTLAFTVKNGEAFLPQFITTFPIQLNSVSLRRPTLEDVFIKVTGHDIREESNSKFPKTKRSPHARGNRQ